MPKLPPPDRPVSLCTLSICAHERPNQCSIPWCIASPGPVTLRHHHSPFPRDPPWSFSASLARDWGLDMRLCPPVCSSYRRLPRSLGGIRACCRLPSDGGRIGWWSRDEHQQSATKVVWSCRKANRQILAVTRARGMLQIETLRGRSPFAEYLRWSIEGRVERGSDPGSAVNEDHHKKLLPGAAIRQQTS